MGVLGAARIKGKRWDRHEKLAKDQAFKYSTSVSAEYYRHVCVQRDVALQLLRVGVVNRIS